MKHSLKQTQDEDLNQQGKLAKREAQAPGTHNEQNFSERQTKHESIDTEMLGFRGDGQESFRCLRCKKVVLLAQGQDPWA